MSKTYIGIVQTTASIGYKQLRSSLEYGHSVIEAHHNDYFTRSQNNDSTNIIIISPNYHRIIHKNNPRFNCMNQRSTAKGKVKFRFEFEYGEVLRLKAAS